jgi:hypothetical protein
MIENPLALKDFQRTSQGIQIAREPKISGVLNREWLSR